jgi:glyoxylase-like metal-dependent hydrolase (beta-lactamase superfamily II)
MPALVVQAVPVGPLSCNCVVVGDSVSSEAVIVDPGGDAERLLDLLSVLRLRVSVIINTHAHFDHVGANAALRRATGAPLKMHADDVPLYDSLRQQAVFFGGLLPVPERAPVDDTLSDGQRLEVGAARATVLHTPGHSPGSICLLFDADPPLLLSGDTLFAGGIGRSDLSGGDPAALRRSLTTRILTLDDRTRVIPGHGPETTIGAERRTNPFLMEV